VGISSSFWFFFNSAGAQEVGEGEKKGRGEPVRYARQKRSEKETKGDGPWPPSYSCNLFFFPSFSEEKEKKGGKGEGKTARLTSQYLEKGKKKEVPQKELRLQLDLFQFGGRKGGRKKGGMLRFSQGGRGPPASGSV